MVLPRRGGAVDQARVARVSASSACVLRTDARADAVADPLADDIIARAVLDGVWPALLRVRRIDSTIFKHRAPES